MLSDDDIRALREAIAAGPTLGPWTSMHACIGEQCVARLNNHDVVPPKGVDLAHESIDARYIAAASPDRIASLLDEVERLRAALEVSSAATAAAAVSKARWQASTNEELNRLSAQANYLRAATLVPNATREDMLEAARYLRQCAEAEPASDRSEMIDLLWAANHALRLAAAICDAVPNREPGHVGKLVNAQEDGTHGYRVIHDAADAVHRFLAEPTEDKLAPKAEPVAWLHPANSSCVTTDPDGYERGIPLYTHLQPQQADVEDDSRWLGPFTTATEALNELRIAVATMMGTDPNTWPDHGNAPLAIAAAFGIRQNALERHPSAQAGVPAGWKLVPVEPTPAMTAAYSVAAEELTKQHLLSGSYPASWQPIEAGYRAMLAAAPTPPVQQDDEALEPDMQSAWISVQDRMPPDDTPVLVCVPGNEMLAFAIDQWQMQREAPLGWSSATIETGMGWGDHDYEDVSHWMPLTAPGHPLDPDEPPECCGRPLSCADDVRALLAEVERLREFERSAALTLPGVYYMDPPDGGDVSLLKQLQRMSIDAARYRLLRRKFAIISDGNGNAEFCSINLPRPTYIAPNTAIELDTALDRERLGMDGAERPPTPVGWSDTDWIKHLQEQDEQPHPLAGQHINQGSMDAAADAYEAEYNAARGIT